MAALPEDGNVTADGQYEINYDGNLASVSVSGTFDGATVSMEFSPDGGTTWLDIDATLTEFTANGAANIITGFTDLRADVSGGGGSLDINIYVRPIVGQKYTRY